MFFDEELVPSKHVVLSQGLVLISDLSINQQGM
jgi:hypothetical protein